MATSLSQWTKILGPSFAGPCIVLILHEESKRKSKNKKFELKLIIIDNVLSDKC